MSELCLSRIDVSDRNGGSKLPSVGSTTVKVGPAPLHRTGELVSPGRSVERERGVGVVGVPDPHVVHGLRVVHSSLVGVVGAATWCTTR